MVSLTNSQKTLKCYPEARQACFLSHPFHFVVCSLIILYYNSVVPEFIVVFEMSHPCCVDQLHNQKNILNIWSEHNCMLSHILLHTTTCFGPVYWPSSGCIINLTSSYTIYAWVLWADEISSCKTRQGRNM